jgi:Uma2 family endonuclease
MTIDVERYMTITPANWIPGPGQGNWTYNAYAALPEDGHRYEIVDGVLLDMMPAPGIPHQNAAQWLFRYLAACIIDTNFGKVFMAPIDVELMPGAVFQPDIVVILNDGLHKISESHIVGAPDLIVEVASPRTAKYDQTTKREAYAFAGVTEYWLVDPAAHTIEVLFLEDGLYISGGIFKGQDKLVSQVVPTIEDIDVEKFFS